MTRSLTTALGAAALALTAFAGAAHADGEPEAQVAAPAEEGRKLAITFTAGATSDYVFRGVSQTQEDPAAQGSIDLSYGIIYAGVWASGVDFADAPKATAEIDLYAGIKPVWGPVTFDFGGIYYAYPNSGEFVNANLELSNLDYYEAKAGYSIANPWFKNLVTGTTVYWSPDYSFETGEVWTVESVASYTFPQMGIFTPSISGLYGWQSGERADGYSVGGGTDDEFQYWNAGLSLVVEKFTFDFRYHDTDINVLGNGGGTVCANTPGSFASQSNLDDLCDERFVFTAKVTLP